MLFAEKDGTRSSSRIMAFEDTREWNVANLFTWKSKSHIKEGAPLFRVLCGRVDARMHVHPE